MVKKKNSWIGKNFLKVIIGISILALAGAGVYAITQLDLDFSKLLTPQISFPSGVSPQIIQQTPRDPSCTFSFDKSQALVGEDVTATIRDGALKSCVVAYDYENTGWVIASIEDLDIDGKVIETRSADTSGTYVWTAVCGYFEGANFIIECRTNDATIEILGDCTETDGGNVITVPGITTFDGIGYMDVCVATDSRIVHEYWCEDDTLHEGNFMCPTGSTCYQTRSGAYCLTPTAPPTWNVGDVVSDISNSGTMPETGGLGYEFHDLTDFEIVPGGTSRLGARIYTNWDYVNQDACYGWIVQEGMQWDFYDSSGLVWSATDPMPQSHSVDLCPLNWDGTNLWFLDFYRTQVVPECDITYDWNVKIYVCE